jgi:hypothetical protein
MARRETKAPISRFYGAIDKEEKNKQKSASDNPPVGWMLPPQEQNRYIYM